MKKINVAVLGATGTVGQKFIRLLENHPLFSVSELVASERSAGKSYAEAAAWKQETPIPAEIAQMTVKPLSAGLASPLLFSGLDSSIAGEAETDYAAAGHTVISNSSNHRMDSDVPIIIPEINPDHFELVKHQQGPGAIVTNSNCSTMFLAMVLAPLDRCFGVEAVQVTTMQAISGAGYPGVASMDIVGNVIPYIRDEEEKMEEEVAKILGKLNDDHVDVHPMTLSAQCNRVPVVDGHMEAVSVKLAESATAHEIRAALVAFEGLPQERDLPTAPRRPIVLMEEPDRPQPARDVWVENGMSAVVGRIRPCNVLDFKMMILGHNTVRGAAGAAILNAEAYHALGYLS
ncbi:MAG: aspartate-semialdehyde dehydrogenase [Spirochaetales bacterium]|nr:aspartate-semialdehyde dehydrogenase [Spirochaetales bacterium]